MEFETIYLILASLKHNKHYLDRYIKFIEGCDVKNKNFCGYVERHHILPKGKNLFPEYKSFKKYPWNEIKLTARQHFLAHMMLRKVYYWSRSANHAAWRMANNKNCNGKIGNDKKVTSRHYQLIKENLKHTVETKRKIGEWSRGKTYEEIYDKDQANLLRKSRSISNSSRRLSDETKRKIGSKNKGSVGNPGPMKEETKRKLSKSHMNKSVKNGRIYIIYDNNGNEYKGEYGLRRLWKENTDGAPFPTSWKKMEIGVMVTIKRRKYKGWSCIRIK